MCTATRLNHRGGRWLVFFGVRDNHQAHPDHCPCAVSNHMLVAADDGHHHHPARDDDDAAAADGADADAARGGGGGDDDGTTSCLPAAATTGPAAKVAKPTIRPDAVRGVDYELVSTPMWRLLVAVYGPCDVVLAVPYSPRSMTAPRLLQPKVSVIVRRRRRRRRRSFVAVVVVVVVVCRSRRHRSRGMGYLTAGTWAV
jgi:hypothetical protein